MILWGGIRMLWTRPEYFNSDSSSRTLRFLMAMSHLKLPASSGSPKYQTHMCHTEMQRKSTVPYTIWQIFFSTWKCMIEQETEINLVHTTVQSAVTIWQVFLSTCSRRKLGFRMLHSIRVCNEIFTNTVKCKWLNQYTNWKLFVDGLNCFSSSARKIEIHHAFKDGFSMLTTAHCILLHTWYFWPEKNIITVDFLNSRRMRVNARYCAEFKLERKAEVGPDWSHSPVLGPPD